jgi:hypothetical protein
MREELSNKLLAGIRETPHFLVNTCRILLLHSTLISCIDFLDIPSRTKDHLATELLRFGDSVGNVLNCSNLLQNAGLPDILLTREDVLREQGGGSRWILLRSTRFSL